MPLSAQRKTVARTIPRLRLLLAAVALAVMARSTPAAQPEGPAPAAPPNVILVITDDQGYGDVAAHGNTMIRTPNLDELHARSVRLTNFHVDPTCAPTRSALMTGRYSCRVGVWHTIMGRSLLRRDEVTLADLFAASGYRTAMFGKWHLGDNYPYRPQYRGFQEVLCHGGGGVGQTPDFWGNDYFDDTYFHNGKPEKFTGYCTDIWFDGAMRFVEANRKGPFFVYLATNAPHGPYLVAPEYSEPYVARGVPRPMAEFYGMITNIDDNMNRLQRKLIELGLAENTLLIFMTDNGTAAGVAGNQKEGETGWKGFNAGMKGQKGSEYDGGHRVPCFFHWPGGGLAGGRDVDRLTAHVDILPTLAEICGLAVPEAVALDGSSLVPLLAGPTNDWPERTLFVESHRIDHPEPWRQSAVMTQRWRLVDGQELYDMVEDPGQAKNVAGENAEVVKQLRVAYERRYADVSRRFAEYCPIVIGAEQENPTTITAHDWHAEQVPWNHEQIRKMPYQNGFWAIDVARPGKYRFTLRHQPAQATFALEAKTARLKIGETEATQPVPAGATAVSLEVELKQGETRMQTWLTNEDGKERGAFFIDVLRLP
jgi:arylsulfatase A-like enzyme